jgi:GTPase SAR1 family protein
MIICQPHVDKRAVLLACDQISAMINRRLVELYFDGNMMANHQRTPLSALQSESDVEQKFVYPLLTSDHPLGLGIDPTAVITKQNIRRFLIGKGTSRKSYYPDYIVAVGGFPLIIVEAKQPGEDLTAAYDEARLYASELNAVYPHGINPASRIIATDGAKLVCGYNDTSTPTHSLTHADFEAYSVRWADLAEFVGNKALLAEASRLSALIRPKQWRKPRRLMGGLFMQAEEIEHNTFGVTVRANFGHIFNPITRKDRTNIAKNGYVASLRRDRLIEPIDRVVRASIPADVAAQQIQDTDSPREVVGHLRRGRDLEHQIMLIVGTVGAGKSTFIDRLREHSLPKEVRDKTVWVHLDMNNAPISRDQIYNWLRQEIVKGCQVAYPDLDFDELGTMKRVYSVEINRIVKMYSGKLSAEKLGETLERLESDLHAKALAYCRFCSTERGKLLIVVLDNCDKRTRDEQLLMFEAAQWLRREFKTLVVLPLREETFDNHRDEPPLDTALKDLVFRIEPAPFHSVLVKRIQLTLDAIDKGQAKTHKFSLPNGFTVQYSASDQAYFLSSIVRSIFMHDYQVRRLIVGLSGRNLRKALEIFLQFCNSGHIGEDHIVRIIQSEGSYVLPLDLVVRVLVRMDKRFYDDEHSFIRNLFSLEPQDARPTHLTRLLIVRWLFERWEQNGPSGLKGYFPIRDLVAELNLHGVDKGVAMREIEALARAQCVLTENLVTKDLTPEDLVRLGPAGFVHLELVGNLSYLAAVAEDTYFPVVAVADRVAERIKTYDAQFRDEVILENARELFDLLADESGRSDKIGSAMVADSNFRRLADLSSIKTAITAKERSDPWLTAKERYKRGSRFKAVVVNVNQHGVFAELEPGITGLVLSSSLPAAYEQNDAMGVGEQVEVEVVNVNPQRKTVRLLISSPALRNARPAGRQSRR